MSWVWGGSWALIFLQVSQKLLMQSWWGVTALLEGRQFWEHLSFCTLKLNSIWSCFAVSPHSWPCLPSPQSCCEQVAVGAGCLCLDSDCPELSASCILQHRTYAEEAKGGGAACLKPHVDRGSQMRTLSLINNQLEACTQKGALTGLREYFHLTALNMNSLMNRTT